MWAHYAQRHEGLCLEFAIDQDKIQRTGDALVDVKYTSHRTQQDTIPPDLEAAMPIGQLQNLCATKFSHWRYEREVRLLVDLHDQRIAGRPDMRFMPLDECLELKKIFMGEKSLHYLESIENALGTKDIPIFQTRAAFSKFAVVLQQDRKYWISRRRNRENPTHNNASPH